MLGAELVVGITAVPTPRQATSETQAGTGLPLGRSPVRTSWQSWLMGSLMSLAATRHKCARPGKPCRPILLTKFSDRQKSKPHIGQNCREKNSTFFHFDRFYILTTCNMYPAEQSTFLALNLCNSTHHHTQMGHFMNKQTNMGWINIFNILLCILVSRRACKPFQASRVISCGLIHLHILL